MSLYQKIAIGLTASTIALTGCGKDPGNSPVQNSPTPNEQPQTRPANTLTGKIIIKGNEFSTNFGTNENYARVFGIIQAYQNKKIAEAKEGEKDLEILTEGAKQAFLETMDLDGKLGVQPEEAEAYANSKNDTGNERTWAKNALPATVTGTRFNYKEPDIAVDTEEDKKQLEETIQKFTAIHNQRLQRTVEKYGVPQKLYGGPGFEAYAKEFAIRRFKPEQIGNAVYFTKAIIASFAESVNNEAERPANNNTENTPDTTGEDTKVKTENKTGETPWDN